MKKKTLFLSIAQGKKIIRVLGNRGSFYKKAGVLHFRANSKSRVITGAVNGIDLWAGWRLY